MCGGRGGRRKKEGGEEERRGASLGEFRSRTSLPSLTNLRSRPLVRSGPAPVEHAAGRELLGAGFLWNASVLQMAVCYILQPSILYGLAVLFHPAPSLVFHVLGSADTGDDSAFSSQQPTGWTDIQRFFPERTEHGVSGVIPTLRCFG